MAAAVARARDRRPPCRSRASGPRRSRARRPEAVILPGDITAAGERVLALCFRFVGASLAGEVGGRRGHPRAVRGRFRARIQAPKRGRAVSGRTPGTAGEVRAGVASGQDTADRVRTLGASQAAQRWERQAGNLRLSGVHAYLRDQREEGALCGSAQDGACKRMRAVVRGYFQYHGAWRETGGSWRVFAGRWPGTGGRRCGVAARNAG